MTVEHIMTKNVESVSANANLVSAAAKMRDHDIGALPVQRGKDIVGILTDRDLTIRGIAEKKDLEETTVKDVMSEDLVTCQKDDAVEDLASKMAAHQLRRIIVTDGNGKAEGFVSLGDLATEDLSPRNIKRVLKRISTPEVDD